MPPWTNANLGVKQCHRKEEGFQGKFCTLHYVLKEVDVI